ncbi:MAG: HisA/HisF-related TIM barrel protein [Candidatus Methylomirabilales bacterium]
MSHLILLVAVDLSGGRVVRLTRGDMGEATVYGRDAVRAALRWQEEGAEWLHVVDLDGATTGRPENRAAIEAVIKEAGIPVQVSGGIRSLSAIGRWLEAGAARVCIGTKALDAAFLGSALLEFGESILPAVDAAAGMVRVEGWLRGTDRSAVEVARELAGAGASRLMFTDIGRDGTLAGPNLESIEGVLEAAGIPVIASGGVSGEEDLQRLARLVGKGLEGVVVGRALYSGALSLSRALAAAGVPV